MCVVAVAGLVVLVIGDRFHDISGELYTAARLANIPFNLWAALLGVLLFQEHPGLTPD